MMDNMDEMDEMDGVDEVDETCWAIVDCLFSVVRSRLRAKQRHAGDPTPSRITCSRHLRPPKCAAASRTSMAARFPSAS